MSPPKLSTFALTSIGPVRLYSTEELVAMPPTTWLIEDTLPMGGLVGLIGQPGVCKTFVAIDMALSVATGVPWHGHVTQRGFVLYVSAEGGTGIGKRVAAWLRDHHLTPRQAHMAWLIEAITINNESSGMDRLLARIHEELEAYPTLIVIDTLARCFEGDENQQEDMGRFVAGVDRLRAECGATVMVVHHTRLGGDRERGNTAFRGAADTMLFVTEGETRAATPPEHRGPFTVSNNKQKDAKEFAPQVFTLKVVPDTDSCVVTSTPTHTPPLTAEMIFDVLCVAGPMSWNTWWETVGSGVGKSVFNRRVANLLKSGRIIKENGLWRVT